MREKVYRGLLALMIVVLLSGIVTAALAQPTGVGGSSAVFSRVWIIQDQGMTALNVMQDNRAGTAIAVTDGDGNAAWSVTGAGDVILGSDPTGGNLGAKTQAFGVPGLRFFGCGAGTNGTTETVNYVSDTPAAAWAPVNATSTESTDVLVTAGGVYAIGTSAYQMNWLATAIDGSGFTNDIANDDLQTADDYITFLMRSTEPLAAGDLELVINDTTPAITTYSIPATPANVWIQHSVDISAIADADVVDTVQVLMSAQGATAHGAFVTYLDYMYKWDAADKCVLNDTVYQDGVLGVIGTTTGTNLVEYTDYFVYYDAAGAADGIVSITDQSGQAGLAALVALEP